MSSKANLMVRRRLFGAVSNHGPHAAILRDARKGALLRMRASVGASAALAMTAGRKFISRGLRVVNPLLPDTSILVAELVQLSANTFIRGPVLVELVERRQGKRPVGLHGLDQLGVLVGELLEHEVFVIAGH